MWNDLYAQEMQQTKFKKTKFPSFLPSANPSTDHSAFSANSPKLIFLNSRNLERA